MCAGRVSNSPYPTSGTRRLTLATHPVISHEKVKYGVVITTNGTYPWSLVTQIFLTVN